MVRPTKTLCLMLISRHFTIFLLFILVNYSVLKKKIDCTEFI
jgi:hypothetical protein